MKPGMGSAKKKRDSPTRLGQLFDRAAARIPQAVAEERAQREARKKADREAHEHGRAPVA